MHVVMEHIFSQPVTGFPVPLVRVHHRRYHILFSACDLFGQFIRFGIELFCILISAVPLEIFGIYIKYHFIEYIGVRL